MKTLKNLTIVALLLTATITNAQIFEKLGKRAEKAMERTVERRVEKETTKSTDRVLDSVIDAPKKSKKQKKRERKGKRNEGFSIGGPSTDSGNDNSNGNRSKNEIKANSNFDFQPGNTAIFEDDFNRDNAGDFPAKWDTNGSGEIVTVNGEKWFRLANSSMFIPMIGQNLPENYTIEFDLLTTGVDNKTSSQAIVALFLSDNNKYEKGKNWSMVELSPCQFIHSPGAVEKVVNGTREMRNQVGKDYRNQINGKSKISIAVNKTRMRVWLDDNKIIDIPRLVPDEITNFKIGTRGLRDERGKDEIHIDNFRIAKSGEDNRSKLLTEGKLSTNAILFNSGSATIKSGSESILKEIADAMKSAPEIKIQIIGHTDSDGDSNSNLQLSKDRAASVKDMLVTQYGISASRLVTDGKGESISVADNGSSSGKAQNRRVEFIKMQTN